MRSDSDSSIVESAFGEGNRSKLIAAYFAATSQPPSANNAWAHVYRMLLWTDRTTGLAHCYESDKCQPGKPWYARSLAFHDWLARSIGTGPGSVPEQIDWMFQKAAAELASEALRRTAALAEKAAAQRAPFAGRGFPAPGQDPELISIIRQSLGPRLSGEPDAAEWAALVQRVREYLMLDNKRKNLLGEGFEDVIGELVRKTSKSSKTKVHVRTLLHGLPGFHRARHGTKPNKVDVAVIGPKHRTLVTAKWSVRADREKQFFADYEEYQQAESAGELFHYVFVTNEFDPARLARACEKIHANKPMFNYVVHLNTDALRAAYGASPERSMRRVLEHVESGRLISLEKWLVTLGG